MNHWIKGQLEESPMPSQHVVRPAVPLEETAQPFSLVADAVQELGAAADTLAATPQNVQPPKDKAEGQDIVYETPLVDPNLPQ